MVGTREPNCPDVRLLISVTEADLRGPQTVSTHVAVLNRPTHSSSERTTGLPGVCHASHVQPIRPDPDAQCRCPGLPQLAGDLLPMPAYNLAHTQRASMVLERGDGLLI